MTQRFANEFGSCQVTSLPGSPQVAVSHGVFVLPQFRRKGYGDANHKARLKRMKEMHFDYVVCTVDETNGAEMKNLTDNGWDPLDKFVSSVTGHTIFLMGRHL